MALPPGRPCTWRTRPPPSSPMSSAARSSMTSGCAASPPCPKPTCAAPAGKTSSPRPRPSTAIHPPCGASWPWRTSNGHHPCALVYQRNRLRPATAGRHAPAVNAPGRRSAPRRRRLDRRPLGPARLGRRARRPAPGSRLPGPGRPRPPLARPRRVARLPAAAPPAAGPAATPPGPAAQAHLAALKARFATTAPARPRAHPETGS
jgi:hypothetical protein